MFYFQQILYNLFMGIENQIDITEILKHAIEQTKIPHFITNIDGIIIYTNKSFLENTGYTKKQVIGKKPSIIKSGKHNSEFYKKLWDTIKSGKPYMTRIINKRIDGSLYHANLVIQPVSLNGKIEFFLAREEDLSQLIDLENKLIESQKLESVGYMVSEIAHNFNNFLTVVIGGIETILPDIDKKTINYELATQILKNAKEQAEIIKQLLMFSRKSSKKLPFVNININNILNEMKPLIQSQLTTQIKLKYELNENIYTINGDEQLIKQAILNITSNAKDAINGVGELIIKTYTHQCFNEYEEPYHLGDYSVIEIVDSGCGLDSEVEKHLFEPFFTTKQKGKGTGLGLSSAYGIIKNHDGYIYASNRKDGKKGASFRIYLPSI